MQADQLIKAFTATVQASLHGLRSLESVMQDEHRALTGRDPDGLRAIVDAKLALLEQLEHSIKARDRLQQAAGLEPGLEGGHRLVDTLSQAALSDEWAQLTELARRVAELNDRNGQLALQGQRNTRNALGILTGRTVKDDTYATLRRKASQTASHTLARV